MLSQGYLDSMAQTALAAYGTLAETVTYSAKSSPTAAIVTYTITMHLGQYREGEINLETILREDQRALVKTASVAFTPTPYDAFVRADAARWQVISARGGPGFPFWVLQCRRVA